MMMMGDYYCGDGWLWLRWMDEGGVELCFFLFIILGIRGERGREKGVRSGRRKKKKKRVIIERRENVDVDASGAAPCKAGVVSKWQMVRLR